MHLSDKMFNSRALFDIINYKALTDSRNCTAQLQKEADFVFNEIVSIFNQPTELVTK